MLHPACNSHHLSLSQLFSKRTVGMQHTATVSEWKGVLQLLLTVITASLVRFRRILKIQTRGWVREQVNEGFSELPDLSPALSKLLLFVMSLSFQHSFIYPRISMTHLALLFKPFIKFVTYGGEQDVSWMALTKPWSHRFAAVMMGGDRIALSRL